jgi:hypothetical protein
MGHDRGITSMSKPKRLRENLNNNNYHGTQYIFITTMNSLNLKSQKHLRQSNLSRMLNKNAEKHTKI